MLVNAARVCTSRISHPPLLHLLASATTLVHSFSFVFFLCHSHPHHTSSFPSHVCSTRDEEWESWEKHKESTNQCSLWYDYAHKDVGRRFRGEGDITDHHRGRRDRRTAGEGCLPGGGTHGQRRGGGRENGPSAGRVTWYGWRTEYRSRWSQVRVEVQPDTRSQRMSDQPSQFAGKWGGSLNASLSGRTPGKCQANLDPLVTLQPKGCPTMLSQAWNYSERAGMIWTSTRPGNLFPSLQYVW